MREHTHLPAMVGFVRKHVAQHFQANRPRPSPAVSAKLLDAGDRELKRRWARTFQRENSALRRLGAAEVKTIRRVPGTNDVSIINWYNLRAERSKGIEDVPQRLELTALWELPFAKQGHPVTRFVLGGWHFNAISTLRRLAEAGPRRLPVPIHELVQGHVVHAEVSTFVESA
jgi:hypothetical protein